MKTVVYIQSWKQTRNEKKFKILLLYQQRQLFMFAQCFPNSKELLQYYLIAHSAGTQHFIHLSLSHTHTFWIISAEISFTVALIKADCDILLNSAPIKTWHCLKHYQMMLSSVRALILRPSIFIKEQVPIFLFQRQNCKVSSLFTCM